MPDALKRTPLYHRHVAAGAKIVPFAGWEMPVQYPAGITAEHKGVREGAGLFDVTHMGEFEVEGKDALRFVSWVTSNDPSVLEPGKGIQYSCFLHESGGMVDDCLVYRLEDQAFMLVVNASNTQKDWDHCLGQASRFDVKLTNRSDETALVALQGPKAQATLQPLTKVPLDPIKYYNFTKGDVAGVPCIISRTGYTGEDGFELYHDPDQAEKLWDAIVARPGGGVTYAGLGARDSLRLEVGYPLYGNDVDDETTPLEGGLNWIVKLKKTDFLGKKALEAQKAKGLTRRLAGFTLTERGFPRAHMPVVVDGKPSGQGGVRSGTVSPSLGIPIGTAYLPMSHQQPGAKFQVDIRGKMVGAEVVAMPFYTKGSRR